MHPRRFRILITALVVTAFGALPAMAGAEGVTLRANGEALEAGDPITLFSENFIPFAGKNGTVECAESELTGEVSENPGAGVVLENGGRIEGGGTMFVGGTELCWLTGWLGRIETKVESVEFRTELRFREDLETGKIRASVEMDFEIAYWDRALSTEGPIGICRNIAQMRGSVEGDTISASATAFAAAEGSRGGVMPCFLEGGFTGDFRLSSEGKPVSVM
jgi:hypothetical protein